MNTKTAVAQALNPNAAKALESRKVAALMALAMALGASIDADREAEAQGTNACDHYMIAWAYGASAEEIKDTTLAHFDGDDDGTKRARNRCDQYRLYCVKLAEAGIPLLSSEGRLRESVTVTIEGEEHTGTLGGIAQKLVKAGQRAKGAKRGTKARTTGGTSEDAEGGKVEGPVTVGTVNLGELSSIPVTPELVERIGQALATVEGAKLRAVLVETCPDAILTMAAAITAKRAQAEAIRQEQRDKAEAKRAEADARRAAGVAELSEDAIADAMLTDLTAYSGLTREEMIGQEG